MANNTQNEDLIAAKTRDTTAAAKLKEMKLAILKKEYVKLEEVNKRWTDQAGRVKAKLLALPARLSPQLASLGITEPGHKINRSGIIDAINSVLTGAVNEALNELAGGYEA
ncbi:MAG: hypothetical protein IJS39_04470 [Synergistaceae bacterium]|nr:hypothetical protein [Synergistaceae bacterium]